MWGIGRGSDYGANHGVTRGGGGAGGGARRGAAHSYTLIAVVNAGYSRQPTIFIHPDMSPFKLENPN